MEEKKDQVEEISIHKQLKKIDEMERSVSELQTHLNFLLKQESKEKKKIDDLYSSSVRTAGNKLNHVSMHIHNKELLKSRTNDCTQKQSQVKEMRQKQIDHLRETRLEVSNLKQRETKQLKELSRQNEMIIKAARQADKENNMSKVSLKRKETKEKKQKLIAEKQLMVKLIEEKNLKQKKKRIAQEKQLQDKMEKIKKEQELVEERIQRKQEMQKKIDYTVKGIITMQDEEVEAFAKTCRSENPFKNVYEQEKTSSSNFKKEELLKKALHQDKPYML